SRIAKSICCSRSRFTITLRSSLFHSAIRNRDYCFLLSSSPASSETHQTKHRADHLFRLQTSIGGEPTLRCCRSQMREKRKLRKLAEKIESQHWDAVMKNRRIAGLTLL